MCSGATPVAVDVLLELSALDDLASFKHALQHHQSPAAVNSFASWYGRSAGPARQLGLHDRTPLMVAALHGSTAVLAYLLSRPDVDVGLRSPSDGATALQLASADAARMLLDSVKPTAAAAAAPSPKKKEYPTDLTMPDINDGVYGTDEFRMYSFKVKTCSRAYTHDWTECPFVHPGENARRRCPAKYAYSCVPCPEFRKSSSCRNGDACEYAHGVFESWLHPAQYRTRLCKDEVGCGRKVCFFAHRKEELRSVDRTAASVGVGSFDAAAAMSPSALGSSAAMWMNQPPSLQLPSATASRLKSSLSYRDRDLGMGAYQQQQQKVFDEMSSTASPRASWPARANSFTAATRATDYGSLLGSLDPSVRSQLLAGYVSSLQSSVAAAKAANTMSSFGLDHSMAKAIISSRSAAFAQRSQSFCDRGAAAARHPPSALSPVSGGTGMSGWGSRDGIVDWGIHGEELSKLRKSATFAFRGNNRGSVSPPKPVVRGSHDDEPDLSWVQSLVKDGPAAAAAAAAPPVRVGLGLTPKQYQIDGVGTGRSELFSPWVEVEQLVA
ncbi:putative zinc finger CCCH domain-containing protein 33 [Iris pallida]|uniref:Zinc finger CCCH domain-containing protein 33 n=1 Tax=Iris pallida TaxID=29817 RepID=A0AAX6I138_IRIPA|nr:putative zinc finger CCCH domain-containing protein 33 [Iris pallida]